MGADPIPGGFLGIFSPWLAGRAKLRATTLISWSARGDQFVLPQTPAP